ncbi:radical SAM protein [Sedimentibacter sp. zth1]|uniref:radical SAM/SPASM domain-containing protein n=1 Tax=Sedimentibacter sp. zth1 TaxID=2816908 RepID=UPI001A90FE8D|nr:radical SAM protein [Sedimentibacter sp. zth1]QSX04998.1 radical SAM protein [Sedimentibacter sp. zth1]
MSLEDDMLSVKSGKAINPLQVEVHLTSACNHDCKWCIYKGIRNTKNTSMTYDSAITLMDSLKKSSCDTVLFSGGGEPLMHKNAEQIICYAHSLKMNCVLITNGALLKNVNLARLTKALTVIRISFDSYDENSFHLVHRPKNKTDSFEELCTSVKKIVELKSENTLVILSYILDEESISGVNKFVELSINLGVDEVDIKTDHNLSYTKRKVLSDQARDVLKCFQDNIIISFDPVKHRTNYIKKPWLNLCYQCMIEFDGLIYPCCHKIEKEFIIGDINKEDFVNIWYSDKHQYMINKYYSEKLSCPTCSDSSITKMIRRIINKM